MTTKLEIFRAELDALMAADRYDAPEYDYLVEMVERLEREEKAAKPPASAAAVSTQPAEDPVAKLVAEMNAAAHPERFSDAQLSALVDRYNAAVVEAARVPGAERVDMAQLIRDLLTAGANPDALSHDERDRLVDRYNKAAREVRRPVPRSLEVLRADLDSTDLGTRMRAADELAQRNEIDDATVRQVVSEFNTAVREADAAKARLDPDAFPPEVRGIVEDMRAAVELMETPRDPVEAAVHKALGRYNDAVRSARPPALEEQLAALGIEPSPEPQAEPAGEGYG